VRRPLAVLVALAAVLLLAEWTLRMFPPRSRIQVVRAASARVLGEEAGVATWTGRVPPPCPAGAPRVVVVGTSILAGVQLPREQVFDSLLQGACVENHAEPGFQIEQVRARAQVLLAARPADLLLVEIWPGANLSFTRVGSALYSVPGRAPRLPGLVSRSRLAELAWTSTVPVAPAADPWRQVDTLVDATREAAGGAPVRFILPAPLHQPFARTRAEVPPPHASLAERLGPDLLDMAELFGDLPPESVRIDPCCHLNAEGHQRLAGAVQPWVDGIIERE